MKKLAKPQVTGEIRLYLLPLSLVRRDISDQKPRGRHFRSPKKLDFLFSIVSRLLTLAARNEGFNNGTNVFAATTTSGYMKNRNDAGLFQIPRMRMRTTVPILHAIVKMLIGGGAEGHVIQTRQSQSFAKVLIEGVQRVQMRC